MMEPAEKVVLTEDEYLDREHKAETKSEFLHGEVIAMAGASPRHNVVAGNVARILGSLLRKRPCLIGRARLTTGRQLFDSQASN